MSEVAALKIQRFFKSYTLNKQIKLEELIRNHTNANLLRAIDLRFRCMRAVAAAKFPINKPLEDKSQIVAVIKKVTRLAEEKGIQNLEAVAQLLHHNIILSTAIQAPYYDHIWRKSYKYGCNTQTLLNSSFRQLKNLVVSFDLPIDVEEKEFILSEDILALARAIIQHASTTIIEVIADSTHEELYTISQERFTKIVQKILENYMTPSVVFDNENNIELFSQSIKSCAPL